MEGKKFKIGLNDESATVSHFFHNIGTPYEKPFKDDALRLLGLNGGNDNHEFSEDFGTYNMFPELYKVPFPAPENPKFTFIDLFAGIGGFRIAWAANVFIPLNGMSRHKKHISLIMAKCLMET